MGLTDNQIEILGDRIAGLYQELENDVIRDIARRVKKTGTYTETAELMAKAMHDIGASPAEIKIKVMKQLHATPEYEAEVARNTLEYKKAVKRAIAETERIAKLTCDEIIANAGDMSFNYDLSMWEQSGQKLTKNSAFTRQVRRFQILTGKKLKNLTQTTGFKTPHSTIKVQDAYQHALDKALMKVTTGTFSFDRAVEDCVRELADSGLRSIDYASGRSYQLDTAARMCIRTASAQLASNITMQHCDEMGTDLVEVDSHWGARPEHAVWQGKIYSRSGKNKKYLDFSMCRYGEVDGLCGANCRHTFYPFFEGISTPNTWEEEPEPKGYRDKMYTYTEATPKQRQIERNIRATKREIEVVKAMNGDSKILEAKKRKQINEYYDFSNAMGIRAKDNRLRVVSGSTNLMKTKSHKYLKSLAKSGEDVTIKIKERIIGNDNFRISKSRFLEADYEEIKELKHSLSDRDVRIWYKAKDENIKNLIDKTKSLEEQAKQAYSLRSQYRTQARELMANQEKRKELDKEHPNKSFRELLKHKMRDKNMTRNEALQDIIDTAGKTNKKVNKILGLE